MQIKPQRKPKALWVQTFKDQHAKLNAPNERHRAERLGQAKQRRSQKGNRPQTITKSRCRKVSKAMSAKKRAYHARRDVWLTEPKNRWCEAHEHIWPSQTKPEPATECHHVRGRLSGLLMLEKFWMPICSSCHIWVHANIERARELGLIAAKGDWNRMP